MNEGMTTVCFVGGAARSGTTLVQSILCSDQEANPLLTEVSPLTIMLNGHRDSVKNFRLYPEMYFNDETEIDTLYASLMKKFFYHVKNKYKCKKLVLRAPVITKFFPILKRLVDSVEYRTKFICVIRDPRSTIASMIAWNQRSKEIKDRGIFKNDRNIGEIASFYNSFYMELFRKRKYFTEESLLFIRYEDVVSDVKDAVGRLSSYSGLDIMNYDPLTDWQRVEYDFADKDSIYSPAITGLYGKPISNERIDSYKEMLEANEIAEIEERCELIFRRFNYTREFNEELISEIDEVGGD